MSLYKRTLSYFHELSQIPRRSYEEKRVRKWLISWAREHDWEYEDDEIGNLMIIAKGKNPGSLCLQSHTDMVCVAQENHDWDEEWVTIVEREGVLFWDKTTLWADNGIGVAAMMAVAEMKERPTLELLFTMGEEVWLVGAHNLQFPIKSKHGINLDWSCNTSIGIGCGGTLLIIGRYKPKKIQKKWKLIKIQVTGLEGGHSGIEIHLGRGNAIIELAKIIEERADVIGITDIKAGDADNAIPRSARAICLYDGDIEEFQSWLEKREKKLQKKLQNEDIWITAKIIEDDYDTHYEKGIMGALAEVGSGVQKSLSEDIPLSSWNIGKLRFKEGKLKWCYFLRTNIPKWIEPMKKKIMKKLSTFPQTKNHSITYEMMHETPVWYADPRTNFVRSIVKSIQGRKKEKIPAITTHATVEVWILAQKYPNTQWISVGATCHNMHTTREHIHLADLEEFCERLERIILISSD